MEWQVKLLKAVCQCSSRYVSGSIVRVPESVRVLRQLVAFRSRATFLRTSMILISLSH